GSMARLTTVCAMRSDTVGMPSFLVPPFAFGISTCFTGGGKYDPDDIRFHSLYKFLGRFCSNIAMVSSSMPAAPRLALTCWYDLTGQVCTRWNERESTWRKSGSCPCRGTN